MSLSHVVKEYQSEKLSDIATASHIFKWLEARSSAGSIQLSIPFGRIWLQRFTCPCDGEFSIYDRLHCIRIPSFDALRFCFAKLGKLHRNSGVASRPNDHASDNARVGQGFDTVSERSQGGDGVIRDGGNL